MFKDLPPLYGTFGGSLNISFSGVFCEAGVLSGNASLAHEMLIWATVEVFEPC